MAGRPGPGSRGGSRWTLPLPCLRICSASRLACRRIPRPGILALRASAQAVLAEGAGGGKAAGSTKRLRRPCTGALRPVWRKSVRRSETFSGFLNTDRPTRVIDAQPSLRYISDVGQVGGQNVFGNSPSVYSINREVSPRMTRSPSRSPLRRHQAGQQAPVLQPPPLWAQGCLPVVLHRLRPGPASGDGDPHAPRIRRAPRHGSMENRTS